MEVIAAPARTAPNSPKKRKRKAQTEPHIKKAVSEHISSVNPNKVKKVKKIKEMGSTVVGTNEEKYPILKNDELIKKFMGVPLTNNQKGRIRLTIRESLQGTSNAIYPEIIHGKIQSILKTSPNLTDSQLRRVRILYNMLKTALEGKPMFDNEAPKATAGDATVEKPKKKKIEKDTGEVKEKKDVQEQKKKGPKRYVVFLGNLPLDVDKDKILNHFSEMNEHIKDIRLPKIKDGKKSAITYIELTNEASFEFALSKHHSMMENKRINVLFSTQKGSKISKAEAKSKSAKLIALQKSGKLVGSIPLAKKRSQRRLKLKKARAKAEALQ